jgi:hypothetical protein
VSEQQQIREERGADYGPFRQHWTATGHGWGGLLIQMGWTPPASGVAIDPRHVGLFFVVDKAMREAFKHKADNPLDGCNYFTMSGEAAEDVGPLEYGWSAQHETGKTLVESKPAGEVATCCRVARVYPGNERLPG